VLGIPAEGFYICHLLEDEHRDVKVAGETRIPAGRYQIKLRTAGSIHPKYAEKFPGLHIGMLWLQDVPNFEWIYIHLGNTDKHSEGCLLTGTTPVMHSGGGGTVSDSTSAYKKLYQIVVEAMEENQQVFITIKDWC